MNNIFSDQLKPPESTDESPHYTRRQHCWLNEARELLWELINRRRLLMQMYPRKSLSDEQADFLDTELAECEISIAERNETLSLIENASPLLGAAALIENPDQLLRCAITAMTMSRLSRLYDSGSETIGVASALAAGDDPAGALRLRYAFLENKDFRQYLHIEKKYRNIDSWRVYLTEDALEKILGRSRDAIAAEAADSPNREK